MSEMVFKNIVLAGRALFGKKLHEQIRNNMGGCSLSGLWVGKKKYAGMSTAMLDDKAPFSAPFVAEADIVIVYLPFLKLVRWLKSASGLLEGKIVVIIGAPFISKVLIRDNVCVKAKVLEVDVPFKGYCPDKKFILPKEMTGSSLFDLDKSTVEKVTGFFKMLGTELKWQDYQKYEQDVLEKAIVPRLVAAEMNFRQRRILKEKRNPIVLPEILFADNISSDVVFLQKEKIMALLKKQDVVPVKFVKALKEGQKKLFGAIYKNRNLKI